MKLRSYSIAALAVNLAASLAIGTAFAQGAPTASTQVKPAVEATKPAETKAADAKTVVANEKTTSMKKVAQNDVKNDGKTDAKKVAAHKHSSGAMKAKTATSADASKQDAKTTAKVGVAQTQAPIASK